MNFFVLLFIFLLGFPVNAHAYFDSASGSALMAFVLGLGATVIYFVKSCYTKRVLRKKNACPKPANRVGNSESLVIFSEGKSYWGTFKPVIEELIRRQVSFLYISLDRNDPGLEIDSPFMFSKLMEPSIKTFVVLELLQADVMLSTTPNIGSKGYPLRRPIHVKNLVHVFHAINDSSCYRKGSLDFYDTVILMGDHQKEALRHVETCRNIKKKELIALGLPYLDDLALRQVNSTNSKIDGKEKPHILIAPSWGNKGCFTEFGTQFVIDLAKAGYSITVRLHHHSYKFEPQKVKQWKKELVDYANIQWDGEVFGTTAMEAADIMISDTSSVRFDFSFLYQRPVITCNIPLDKRGDFEASYFEKPWTEEIAPELGVVIGYEELQNICSVVEKLWSSFDPQDLIQLRSRTVANFGNSAPAIVEYLKEKIGYPT